MKIGNLWDNWWKKIIWIGAGGILLIGGGVSWLWFKYFFQPHVLNPWLPAQLQFAQPVFRDVVGDLGGVPVTIPRHYASLVEYEGDPGWGHRRSGPAPQRTHQSRLKSFSIDFRYPDMVGLATPELRVEKRKSTNGNTMWLFFGVSAGSSYPRDDFLDLLENSIDTNYKMLRHEKLPEPQYGLTVYAPVGANPNTRVPFDTHHEDEDVFVNHDDVEHVNTYIECSNVLISSAPCRHTFSLAPRMKAKVTIAYRRGLLPEWRRLQEQVTRLIEDWAVEPSPVESPSVR